MDQFKRMTEKKKSTCHPVCSNGQRPACCDENCQNWVAQRFEKKEKENNHQGQDTGKSNNNNLSILFQTPNNHVQDKAKDKGKGKGNDDNSLILPQIPINQGK